MAARSRAVTCWNMTILSNLSDVEPALLRLGIDSLHSLQLFDAIELGAASFPPVNPDVPVLLLHLDNQPNAVRIKALLLKLYPAGHEVALVYRLGATRHETAKVELARLDQDGSFPIGTCLYVPPLPMKSGLAALAESVAVLRGPGGCPWDQEQTPQSMRETFLEEAYEALAALDAADSDNLREELGDLLFHILMQVQMGTEAGEFTLSDVIAGIEAKLKRRHPHVWGDWLVSGSAEVLSNWELLKQREREARPKEKVVSALDGIPGNLPALARSQKIQRKVAATGFDWPDINGVFDKLTEEVRELIAATTDDERLLELGDVLFVVANLGLWLKVDAESALREANDRFSRRFQQVESLAAERSLLLNQLTFAELDALWEEAKASLAQTVDADKVEDEPS